METSLNLTALTSYVSLLRELQGIVTKTPEVVELAKQSQREYSVPVLPVVPDALLYASEAAKVLHVNKNAIARFERQGLLKAYTTPNSSRKKYWLSDVKQIAKGVKES